MTTSTSPAEFHHHIADRIQQERLTLSARWLARLKQLLPVEAAQVFPSQDILDHIPELLHEIGNYLRAPDEEEIGANTTVIAKSRELGLLRHKQAASVHQLLREYEILGRILQAFVTEEIARMTVEPRATDILAAIGRIHRAVHILMQTTVDTFVAEYTETIACQTQKLESFNRTVSHELRNPIGTLIYAVELLRKSEIADDATRRAQILELAERDCRRIRDLINTISRLTRASDPEDAPSIQRVEVASIAREVARQLGSMAEARRVTIRIGDLPVLLIDPARLELVLMNLVSNAIKYSDPAKSDRYVEIAGGAGTDDGTKTWITVRDNGIGIPEVALPRLFTRFFRAHHARDQELETDGIGLGLSIVSECVKALGGEVTVLSTEGAGSAFTILLPSTGVSHAP